VRASRSGGEDRYDVRSKESHDPPDPADGQDEIDNPDKVTPPAETLSTAVCVT